MKMNFGPRMEAEEFIKTFPSIYPDTTDWGQAQSPKEFMRKHPSKYQDAKLLNFGQARHLRSLL